MGLGNQVLYEMCEKNIAHDNVEVVSAKMWLISRSYAVTPQRRETKDNTIIIDENGFVTTMYEDFFGNIGKILIDDSRSKELDAEIQRLSTARYTASFDEDWPILLDIIRLIDLFNALVMDIIRQYDKVETDGKRVRQQISLASKYLHFHLPQIVFISDSFSSQNASRRYARDKEIAGWKKQISSIDIKSAKVKKEYLPHVLRCYKLFCTLPEVERTPRRVDDILLQDKLIRKKRPKKVPIPSTGVSIP